MWSELSVYRDEPPITDAPQGTERTAYIEVREVF
jgi:hypothetical protein